MSNEFSICDMCEIALSLLTLCFSKSEGDRIVSQSIIIGDHNTYEVIQLDGCLIFYVHLYTHTRMHARTHTNKGVNLFSTNVLREPELVPWIKTKNLVLFTWGDEGCDDIIKLKELGVAAIIYDRSADFTVITAAAVPLIIIAR